MILICYLKGKINDGTLYNKVDFVNISKLFKG